MMNFSPKKIINLAKRLFESRLTFLGKFSLFFVENSMLP